MSYSYYAGMDPSTNCGEDWHWGVGTSSGDWHTIEMYVKVNTDGATPARLPPLVPGYVCLYVYLFASQCAPPHWRCLCVHMDCAVCATKPQADCWWVCAGQANGVQTIKYNGAEVYSKSDILWSKQYHPIEKFTFRSFHGGGSAKWASAQDQYI